MMLREVPQRRRLVNTKWSSGGSFLEEAFTLFIWFLGSCAGWLTEADKNIAAERYALQVIGEAGCPFANTVTR